jgi:hypothetical protein
MCRMRYTLQVWRDRVEDDDCALGASGTGREMDTADRSSARLVDDNVADLGETLRFIDDTRQASER